MKNYTTVSQEVLGIFRENHRIFIITERTVHCKMKYEKTHYVKYVKYVPGAPNSRNVQRFSRVADPWF